MKEVPAFAGKRLSQTAIDLLYGYDFPGNVRELKNIIERAVYRDTTNEVTPEDIGLLGDHRFQAIGGKFNDKVKSFERQLLADARRTANGTARKRPGASAFATISSVTCSKSTGWTRHRRAQGR